MPRTKLKTHRGAAKRFHLSGTGKVMSVPAGRRHLMTDKERGRKRGLRGNEPVSKSNQAAIKKLLPYG